jgi:sec-independent protein translocase protein TatC
MPIPTPTMRAMTTPDAPDAIGESGLIGHLIELRSRLLRGIVGLVVVVAALLPFTSTLYTWLATPLISRLPAGQLMIAMNPAGAFFAPVKLTFFVALFAAAPWLLYQAWAFIAPGLYKREKKLALPLLASAVALFYAGCAFAYFLVLPMVFNFLLRFKPDIVAITPDINAYLDFVLVIFLAFGASFELPVALVILVLLGWVTPAQLREWRGYAVVGIFVVAAVITPPDVVSQLMLAVPMMLLYEAGILASRAVAPNPDASADPSADDPTR